MTFQTKGTIAKSTILGSKTVTGAKGHGPQQNVAELNIRKKEAEAYRSKNNEHRTPTNG